MAKSKNRSDSSAEIEAISAVHAALKDLDPAIQSRVLRYAAEMLGLSGIHVPSERRHREDTTSDNASNEQNVSAEGETTEESEGINAIALKWMKRSGLTVDRLQKLYSLGMDEIDLVARDIPGKGKRERLHNVLLLKGIAAYLSTGAARVTHDQLKEACLHYNAFDATNFAAHLKSISADVSGSRESGYTLTPRGVNNATSLLKQLLQKPAE